MDTNATSLNTFFLRGLAVVTIGITCLLLRIRALRSLPLPPGPTPWPLVGNVTDLTPRELWITAQKWSQQYGDIVYTHLFGKGIIFLNSIDVVNDLLDKRAPLYSDKPRLIMANELCGCGNMVVFTNYGDRARRQRRLMSHTLSASHIHKQNENIELEARGMLERMLEGGDAFAHLRRYSVGYIIRIVYGIELRDGDGTLKLLELEERASDLLANKILAGGGVWAVDMMPSLKHLPEWFPGAGFLRKSRSWKKTFDDLRERPWEILRQNMMSGKFTPSFCSELLQMGTPLTPQVETDIKDTAMSMYSASIDTTSAIVAHFILEMMNHPEVQRKAQAELDTVLGGRLPTCDDRGPLLPYINALVEEVLRWSAVVPLSLPRCLLEDDEYKDMHLPKGSIILVNVWKIVRDEKIYPDSYKFDPERFVEKSNDNVPTRQPDPTQYIFGFGRRRCPGVHLATMSLWFVIASILATFDIKKPLDGNGVPIEPNVTFDNSMFRTPSDFRVDIIPRANAKDMLRNSVRPSALYNQ